MAFLLGYSKDIQHTFLYENYNNMGRGGVFKNFYPSGKLKFLSDYCYKNNSDNFLQDL